MSGESGQDVGVVHTTIDGHRATVVFMRSAEDRTVVAAEHATFAIATLDDGTVLYLYPTPDLLTD